MGWDVISGHRSLRWKRFWKCEVLLNFTIPILTGKCGGYIISKSEIRCYSLVDSGRAVHFFYYVGILPGDISDIIKKASCGASLRSG